ncbi:meiotic nuclear division protein 1 [Coniophora puteana RWD-64-598 SS2]|uniref:Meiotic nuclear division protein 1 n=1 Tax=Coniophora puteana (strain RWD-64-598) TaxID=741705 RepID=A0A5M3MV67_CONPW|nr:meiotic nuclear division protein 1 [Coniophora puteana RWD-64-598 SS2]EIW83016.1 meiotic nuclear division protein 1 [Coniophora puteana RWD-64-598 SS2]
MKGIVQATVKDILQSLVDDSLVQADKIGSSNFFWCFPSQQGTIAQNRLTSLKDAVANNESQLTELRAAIDAEHAMRPQSSTRTQALDSLNAAKRELATLENELSAYGARDPVKLAEKKNAVGLAREAALRWTDNYLILLGHFTRQNGVDAQDIRRYLEIDENYEDLC